MKGSARARTVISAPVKAEDRFLKVCVRRTPLELAWRIRKNLLNCLALVSTVHLFSFTNTQSAHASICAMEIGLRMISRLLFNK